MRKLLNKLLIKFGLLITKAPTLLSDKSLATSDAFPAELTEKVSVVEASETPVNPLFDIFSADTNVHKWHHYFDIYTKHFGQYLDRPIKMLEIGVYRGGSLRMWKDYFHPDSTIVGIDIDKTCKDHEIADRNVFVRIGSQADPHFLAEVNEEFGPFDIILDDGSHKTHHQNISFGALFRPALKDGGCYMVEDVHTNYWLKHVDSEDTFIDLSKQMVDLLHEPYFNRKETHFRHGHPEAVHELKLSYLAANLASIAFYDSVVVFDKKTRYLPTSELR
ncbi:MAG: class I SAM-dependent methyltransferase [Gammaproteobacteria bacterium]|nr:class I SAM-dependent methyltransferase [Gammaproteobacteria bacterium]MBU2678406.1 class I SAM-dependent methyltransferase [Gammaproteobacteria bacterium]NNC58123.1 class I SAM-dependent methyltransferase [Woeseiaceae bacterium]NNL52141.1 class I SAM-dependent methyltransferase [Woeseiaceae bacterium]